MRRRLLLSGLSGVLFFFGCSVHHGMVADGGPPVDGGRGGDGSSGGGALRIEPLDFVATADPVTPVTVTYHAFLRAMDGSESDVSSGVTWITTVPALGTFTGPSFVSTPGMGGVTTIRATMGTLSASTSLTLRLTRDIIGPGAPADAPAHFGGAPDPSAAPTLVYPNDGTMVPPNMEELEFHYMPGSASLFDLHITAPAADLHVYIGCPESVGGGCIYTPDHDTWTTIATAARGAGVVRYELRGATAAGGVGTSATRDITFAGTDVTGGIYYWAAAAGHIMRFDFGVPGAREEIFLDQARASASTCVGCHALSRDGTRISVGTDIPTTAFAVFDVATRAVIFRTAGGFFPSQPDFASWSPDSTRIVQSGSGGLRIIDGTTGATITDNITGHGAAHPDWGPDMSHIVFAKWAGGGPPGSELSITSGSIVMADYDGVNWNEGATLVPSSGDNNYYPAFSPDGHWVVFMKSPTNMGSDVSSGVTDATLWVVPVDMSSPPIHLTMASGAGDSWPKWNPSEYDERGHPIFWLAWSSQRAYGLRYGAGSVVQLWMTAFDPSRGAMGMEPAYPAFRLPFQNIGTGNHIPQWVTTIHRETCSTDVDCGGEFCVDGRCYQQRPLI